MKEDTKITIEFLQNWDNLSGVSEKARARVKVYLTKGGIVFDGNSDRYDVKPAWITLDKEDAIILARQIVNLYTNLNPYDQNK